MQSEAFAAMVREIPSIGMEWHRQTIIENSMANAPHVNLTVRDIPHDKRDVLVISAGPSLHRGALLEIIKAHRKTLCLVATDGAYVKCLRAGIVPDWTLTLDPHPKRMVRWFGDPSLAEHQAEDDYFKRQDLDEAFRTDAERTNAENIRLVDSFASVSKLAICSTSPANVEARTRGMERYWFAPIVDNPAAAGSITREIAAITRLPSLNTGGTVGTAAVMFAHCVLAAPRIAVVGMDLGYARDLPLNRTQSWNMLKDKPNVRDYYPAVYHPVWGECYTDPTYAWYKQNLLALLKSAGRTLYNCTGHGALFGAHVECLTIEEFLG